MIVLGVGVEVPSEDRAVESRRHQQAVLLTVFYVLHPVRVSSEGSDFGLEISGVVQSDRRVIGAACKKPIVEKPVALIERLVYFEKKVSTTLQTFRVRLATKLQILVTKRVRRRSVKLRCMCIPLQQTDCVD